MTNSDEFWCSTCGKTIPIEEYTTNESECDYCHEWWQAQFALHPEIFEESQ